MIIEKDFRKLSMTAQYRTKVEPLKFTCYFLAGIFSLIFGFLLYLHIWLNGLQSMGNKQWGIMFNLSLESMYSNPNTKFLAILFFVLIGAWLFLLVLHGNIKFGLRFFSLSFYPLVPRETFMNSFLINAFIINLWSHALVYLLCDSFRGFTRGT